MRRAHRRLEISLNSRRSDLWIDLWNLATNVDYLIGRCASPAEETRLLATNDFIETGMRRLAAYMYEGRSKDTTGARRMLAVQAPGATSTSRPNGWWPMPQCTPSTSISATSVSPRRPAEAVAAASATAVAEEEHAAGRVAAAASRALALAPVDQHAAAALTFGRR